MRKQKLQQRAKHEKDDEDRMNEHLQRQIERYAIRIVRLGLLMIQRLLKIKKKSESIHSYIIM